MKNKNIDSLTGIQLLIQGNARFISGLKAVTTLMSSRKVKDLANFGQRPFCIILTCSDSRIPIEYIFDRGFGDLFVIRNFGNIVDSYVIASMEYAILNFDIELILILGHSQSGAVRATIENEKESTAGLSRSLEKVVEIIKPSLKKARESENFFSELQVRTVIRDKLFLKTCINNIRNTEIEILKNR